MISGANRSVKQRSVITGSEKVSRRAAKTQGVHRNVFLPALCEIHKYDVVNLVTCTGNSAQTYIES